MKRWQRPEGCRGGRGERTCWPTASSLNEARTPVMKQLALSRRSVASGLSSKVSRKKEEDSGQKPDSRIWNARVQSKGMDKDSTLREKRLPSSCACLKGDSIRIGELEVSRGIKGPDE